MIVEEKFISNIKLDNGDICDVLEMKQGHVWQAMYSVNKIQNDPNPDDKYLLDYGFIPFLVISIVRINGKRTTMEYLENMDAQEYNQKINPVIEASMKKINM